MSFFDKARPFIKTNQFNAVYERHYQVLWRVLCHLRDRFPQFDSAMVGSEATRVLENDPNLLHPFFQYTLLRQDEEGIIFGAFAAADSYISGVYCDGLLKEFLLDRTVASPLRDIMQPMGMGQYPQDLERFLDVVKTHKDLITGMGVMPTRDPVPDPNQSMPPSAVYRKTGVPFIDLPLGGQRDGDVNGLLGLFGSGKSTLGTQLAASFSLVEYTTARAENRTPGLIAYFTYEESAAKLYPRLWSTAFKIPRKKLETMVRPADVLTTPETMASYEYKLNPNGQPLCELQRWNIGRMYMGRTMRVFDMSGSEEYPYAGFGYIDEIAACLDQWANVEGQPPKLVGIDYAGLCCRRYMVRRGIDESKLRFYLTSFADECRHKIADRYHCTVWILHQIAPSETSKSPARPLTHAVAQESKSFAENLAVCGCMGPVDVSTGCRLLTWSKARYADLVDAPSIILKIDPQFAELTQVNTYTIDAVRSRFIPSDVANQYQGTAHSGQTGNGAQVPRQERSRRLASDVDVESTA
jgi:hypothetical protein